MASRAGGSGSASGSTSGSISGGSSSPPAWSSAPPPPSNPLDIPTVTGVGARPLHRSSHSSLSPPTPHAHSSSSPISRPQALPVPIPSHAGAGAGVAARFGQPRGLSGSAAASALASAYELASQQQQQRHAQLQQQQQRRHHNLNQTQQSQLHVAAASSSTATAASASASASAGAFPDGGRNGVTLSQFNPFRGFTAASSSVPNSTATNMLLSSPHAATSAAGTSAFPFAPSASATPPHAAAAAVAATAAQPVPAQPVARSLPVSIPAFRRAISFVGLDQGFELFGPDGPELGSGSNHPPPKIQNVGQLGQQLRQHLWTSPSTAGNSGSAMTDAYQLGTGLELPDIASPPPGGELQLRFDSPPADDEHEAPTNGAHNSPGARLNFDAVHVSAKDQVLGAIPHVVVRTPPQQPQQQQPTTIFHNPPMSSRWAPLSSSAPSHMPSFVQRRDSGSSSIGSSSHAAASQKAFLSLSQQHRHRGAHTPTTIASEDNRPASTHEWSPAPGAGAGDNDDVDDVDDAELDALVSHHFHGDGSSCSLSPCDSCSSESSGFSANLEDDFDVTLTFPQQRDASDDDEQADVHRAVRQRLNQSKRDHHNQHHLQHRRAKMRAQIRAARIEARLRGDNGQGGGGGDDDWKSAQLNEEDTIRVGSYTHGERQRKIQRFLEKRRRRVWSKKILYSCRKNFADRRPRIGGRFVKLTGDAEGAEGDGDAAAAGLAAHTTTSMMMMMLMGAGGGGGGSGGGSLSSSFSPGLLGQGAHGGDGVGLYALTQHMHGALGVPGGGPNMTAFSLPLAAYAHTSFSPALPSAMGAGPATAAAAAAPAASSTLDALTFLKQQTPTSSSSTSAAPSGLAAALGLPQVNRNGQQQQQQHSHTAPDATSSANQPLS